MFCRECDGAHVGVGLGMDAWQGKVITAAGVSAGIDMGLKLVALLSDETTAKVVQLMIEYDPQPPFSCGSPATAGAELVAIAHSWVDELMREIKHEGAAILEY